MTNRPCSLGDFCSEAKCNRQKPSRGASLGVDVERGKGPVGAQQRFLGEVLDVWSAAEHTREQAEHRFLVAEHERPKRHRIPSLTPDQRRPVDLRRARPLLESDPGRHELPHRLI